MRSTGLSLKKEQESFRCNRCGACCKGRDVPLTLDDIYRLSEFLDMGPDDFFARHCIEISQGKDVTARPFLKREGESCRFLGGNLCRVHFAKPSACAHIHRPLFGSLEHVRANMPRTCAIQTTCPEDHGDIDRLRRGYMTAMLLTTIYYSRFGTFKYESAKPFIYRIMLFAQDRARIHGLMGDRAAGN